jgi:hypothetical protein
VSLLTYWRVQAPPSSAIKVFVHLLDEGREGQQTVIAQDDGMGSPPEGWAEGDLLIQKHVIPLPTELSSAEVDLSPYSFQVGVYYAAEDGERLPTLTGDRLLLYSPGVSE